MHNTFSQHREKGFYFPRFDTHLYQGIRELLPAFDQGVPHARRTESIRTDKVQKLFCTRNSMLLV
jgi:hypothetical protein